MMLLFRFNPECEAWFWQSGIGSFLINPHRDVTVSNLTDPLRGGGFLECAQTAALLMFSAPIAAFAAWRFTGKWHWVLLWVLYACGLAATGGKFSILLLTGWLACGLLIKNLRLKCGTALVLTAGILIVFFLILPKCCAPPERTEQWNPRPLKEQWKGQNRVELWKIAWNVIADAPVLGAGYGGWNPYYASQRGKLAYDFKSLNPNPHNIYLLTWIRSGVIPALLLVGAIPLYLLLVYRKTLRAAPGAWDECFMWGGLLYTMFATGLIEDIFFWGRTEYLVPLMAMAVIRSARLLNETRKKTVGA
jgi:O-antigen ligase